MPSMVIGEEVRHMTSTRIAPDALDHWADLIRAEYDEMPGMHLTKPQVQRLFGLDAETCEAVLDELEKTHFLRCTDVNAFVKAELNR
jgi:hypothetical protein